MGAQPSTSLPPPCGGGGGAGWSVRKARARGVNVQAETCPHYLFMTVDVLERDAPARFMCSPPQRTTDDQTALWEAIADGTIQLVTSDHAPYRMDETGKFAHGADAPFHRIANGMPGLETRLPLMFDAMVSGGRGGPEEFARLTAGAPAEIYGLPQKGALAPGMHADITLWDPEMTVTYGENDLHDNVGYNPWVGRTIKGWPTDVWLRGNRIVQGGTFVATPGSGRRIDRPKLAVTPTPRQN